MCDCEIPVLYSAKKIVKTRRSHDCIECGDSISVGSEAEKADGLYSGKFRVFYTCSSCVSLRDRLRQKFPDDELCHGELSDFVWRVNSDLVWTEEEIEGEASRWIEQYDELRGVVRGASCIIACKVPWLSRVGGKFQLVEA